MHALHGSFFECTLCHCRMTSQMTHPPSKIQARGRRAHHFLKTVGHQPFVFTFSPVSVFSFPLLSALKQMVDTCIQQQLHRSSAGVGETIQLSYIVILIVSWSWTSESFCGLVDFYGLWAVSTLYGRWALYAVRHYAMNHVATTLDSAGCWSLSPNIWIWNDCFWPAPQQQPSPPPHHHIHHGSSTVGVQVPSK